MAEGILKHELVLHGRYDIVVSSMGVHGLEQQGPATFAVQVCLQHGIDISSHKSRPLVLDELNEALVILSMEPVQRDFISLFFPKVKEKNFLLGAWPDQESRKSIINDPYGATSLKVYQKTFETIQFHIHRILPHIEYYSSL
ncbi:MAG: hypothetical protein JW795_01105 [Chitinivibrionales bacterium]|nr:hypothetical protein [Chitinivibrionales bacterium]